MTNRGVDYDKGKEKGRAKAEMVVPFYEEIDAWSIQTAEIYLFGRKV